MPARPALSSHGFIRKICEAQRLFEIEMPNGYHTLAVLHHNSPACPLDPIGQKVEVTFSPYDMTRCKIIQWLK